MVARGRASHPPAPPQAEGYYMAESRFFPLAMLRLDAEPLGPRAATTQGDKKQLDHMPLSVWSSNRCAGRI